MKSAIYTSTLTLLAAVVATMWIYVQSYNQEATMLTSALKRSLAYTMVETKEEIANEQRLLEVFASHFELLASSRFRYVIDLMGYNEQPRLMRVKVNAIEKESRVPMKFTLEEVVIEEVKDEGHS